MTIITKVGASYVDHMNDDAPEVDSFSRECYQALSSTPFLRREPGNEARLDGSCEVARTSFPKLPYCKFPVPVW